MTSSSRSVSATGRLEVGSSRMSEARIEAQRLGDLDHLLLGKRERRDTGVAGEKFAPSRSR